MFQTELRQYALDNPRLVKMRQSDRYPGLSVLKYSKQVFYKNSWNPYLEECRGAVVDSDFNLVSYPFSKIYNFGIESRAPVIHRDTKVTAFRKVNGFMAAVSWYQGDLLISTTGSLDSEYVDMVRELIQSKYNYQDWCLFFGRRDMENMTFMFEVCHRNDPHIIPEQEGLYLLGYRENSWHSRVQHDSFVLRELSAELGCFTPECIVTNMGRLQELAKECRHEGYVAYTQDGVSFKIKSPYYLCCKALARKKDIFSLNMERVEEEYFPLINHLHEISDVFNSMTEQDRLLYIHKYLHR